MSKLLIVEDEVKTANALQMGLRGEGFHVELSRTGEGSAARWIAGGFDLVILDWMLPGVAGIEVLKRVRSGGVRTPVLLLTARDAVEDRVLGLETGADDYLVKPFAFAELLARVRALLRRASDADRSHKHLADLFVDLEGRRVRRKDREITLTPREFDLLAYLLRHHDQTVSRQMLARDVWRETQRVTPLDNVIDVHIAHLRRKIDDGENTKLLHTVRGVGFVLREGIRCE